MNNTSAELSPSEIVAAFPDCKKTVKYLIQEHEDFLEGIRVCREEVKESLATHGVSMFDLEFATKLVMTTVGTAEEESRRHLARLTRLLYLYEPPKKSEVGVSNTDIENAKQFPINHLIEVKQKKAKCLWHDDKNPSLHVYRDHVYCFVCNKKADAIDIYMTLNNCDFVTAVKGMV